MIPFGHERIVLLGAMSPIVGNLEEMYVTDASASIVGTIAAESRYAHASSMPAQPPWVSCGYLDSAPVRGSIAEISM
jgi:hypothetical protein